ncbi:MULTISPECIES: helix-turn-helix domain-containing protein [Cohnella]|jgi:putative transcriptional regulator|uniref:helix-turn-helix domain-containing protein n=1 Tax=Cohnella TaxID=329857 RepID=UPI00035C539A|nr:MULTISPECIES: helix-turn-helix transcriptional regulator [Cohnella]
MILGVVRSNLKAIADKEGKSVRRIAKELPYRYETIRQMYNNETKQYPRDLLALLCDYFDCGISDLLIYEEGGNQDE